MKFVVLSDISDTGSISKNAMVRVREQVTVIKSYEKASYKRYKETTHNNIIIRDHCTEDKTSKQRVLISRSWSANLLWST